MKEGMEGLVISTVLAGIMLVIMGVCRLGALIKYIPGTITAGFTFGIAVTIVIGQIKDFFGLTFSETPIETVDKLAEICIELGVDVPHPSELLESDCILCSMNTDERMEHIFNRATDIIAAIDLYYCNFEKDVQSVLDDWLRGWKNLVYYRMRSVPELLSDDAILPLEIE
jgi:hypothetical protein